MPNQIESKICQSDQQGSTASANAISKPFGIKALDEALNKTIKRGNVYEVFGSTGTGKTTLATQFLVEGAKEGNKGFIIVTDSSVEQYVRNAERLSFGFRKYRDEGLIEAIGLSDRFWSLKWSATEDPKNFGRYMEDTTEAIKKLASESNAKRIVIDTITPMLTGDRFDISRFVNSLAVKEAVVIITSGISNNDNSLGYERNVVSGVIELKGTSTDGTKEARIVKMPGTHYEGPIEYTISSEGITPVSSEKVHSMLRIIR